MTALEIINLIIEHWREIDKSVFYGVVVVLSVFLLFRRFHETEYVRSGNQRYKELESSYKMLEERHERLETKYQCLKTEHSGLESKHSELEQDHKQLETELKKNQSIIEDLRFKMEQLSEKFK